MSPWDWAQIALYFGVLLLCVKPLGANMAAVCEGHTPRAVRFLAPLERLIYRACGVRAETEMNWKQYAIAMLLFHAVGFVALFGLQRLQAFLPLNPAGLGSVVPALANNAARENRCDLLAAFNG